MTRLVQIYLSVKNVELEIRPFTDDDEALDVRGQPLMSSSSAPSRPTSSQPQSATANNVSDNAEDHLQLTSPVDDNTEQAPARRKTRKKRRSSGKSEDTGENTTLEQDSKGFPTFKLCYKIVFYCIYFTLLSLLVNKKRFSIVIQIICRLQNYTAWSLRHARMVSMLDMGLPSHYAIGLFYFYQGKVFKLGIGNDLGIF